jgi:hypothetical protein
MKEDSQMHMEESYSGTQTTAPSGNPNIQEDPMAPKIEFYPGNQINPPARQQSLTNEPLIETFQVSSETSTLPRESSLSAAPLPPPKNSMQTQANINFNMHQQETLPEAYIKHIPKVYGIDLDHPLQKAEYYQPMSPEYQKPVEMDEEEALTRLLEHVSLEPNYALLSVLSNAFIRGVKALENVRELWCASEYNESFTGSEAVTIIKNLFKDQLPEEYCVGVANSLMRSDPPVFSPTQYSQRSLISKRMYNSEDTYFLEEDSSDGILPSGVITSATACYSYNCKPGESGCYSPCCPNLKRDYEVEEKV